MARRLVLCPADAAIVDHDLWNAALDVLADRSIHLYQMHFACEFHRLDKLDGLACFVRPVHQKLRVAGSELHDGGDARQRICATVVSSEPSCVSATSTPVHVALEDATGDSAILEYLGGKLVIHHGRHFWVMTNAPAYDEQLKLLGKRDFKNPTMETQVPGNVNPRDRFQRATYFLSVLTKPQTERAGIAGMFGLIRNVSIPFGAPVNGSTFDTEYRTVSDLSNTRYYFELTTAPNVIWADLKKLNLDAGAAVMTLNPNNIDLSGDVTEKFEPAAAPF